MVHRSRLASLIIDCRTDDLDGAAAFWAAALGADVMPAEPNYVALTPQGGLTSSGRAGSPTSRTGP